MSCPVLLAAFLPQEEEGRQAEGGRGQGHAQHQVRQGGAGGRGDCRGACGADGDGAVVLPQVVLPMVVPMVVIVVMVILVMRVCEMGG